MSTRNTLFTILRTFLLAALFSVGATAGFAKDAPKTMADIAQTPENFVQNLGNQAIGILADKTLDPQKRDAQFYAMLSDGFDLKTIGRFVLGRSWQTASEEQRNEYNDLFEKVVIKTYSDRFALYTGEGFKVRNAVPESEKDTIVNSEITHPDGSQPTTVTWRVRRNKEGQLGIIDVIVEGVSMSLTQRQEYASVIQRNGGDLNALLKVMRQRITQDGQQKNQPQEATKS